MMGRHRQTSDVKSRDSVLPHVSVLVLPETETVLKLPPVTNRRQ